MSLRFLVLLTLVPSCLAAAPGAALARMYRGDARHVAVYDAPPLSRTPAVRWRTGVAGAIVATPVVAEGRVFIGSAGNRFYALDLESGRVRWEFETLGEVHSSPAYADGVVYFGDFRGRVYALEAATGAVRWTQDLAGERRFGARGLHGAQPKEKYFVDDWDFFLSAPVVGEGLLYYTSGNGHVYALDLATGAKRWFFSTHDVVHNAPALAEGALYFGGWDGFFYCLDAATGTERWRLEMGRDPEYHNQVGVQSAPVVVDGTVYVGGRDSYLYAIDAASGQVRWKEHHGGTWVVVSPLVVGDRIYYTTSDTRQFVARNRHTGQLHYTLPTSAWGFSSPTGAGRMVYFGLFSGELVAVDREAEAVAWVFRTDAAERDPHDYLDDQGVMDTSRVFHGANAENQGEVMNRLFATGGILSSAVPENGVLVFGSTDGMVYALEAAPGQGGADQP